MNSPTIRRGVSVRLEDLPVERGPGGQLRATPAGLLIIAAVHGAASHGFEKMQHLCDIAQIVRPGRAGGREIIGECVASTGAGFSLATALDLTARSLHEPACAQLLGRLELRWPRRTVRAAYDAGGRGAITGGASPRRNMAAADAAPDVEEPPVRMEKR